MEINSTATGNGALSPYEFLVLLQNEFERADGSIYRSNVELGGCDSLLHSIEDLYDRYKTGQVLAQYSAPETSDNEFTQEPSSREIALAEAERTKKYDPVTNYLDNLIESGTTDTDFVLGPFNEVPPF